MMEFAALFVLIIIGVLAACLALFLNYCMGKPGSEKFSTNEIFSLYTVWLSKRKLKEVGLYSQLWKQSKESFERLKTWPERIKLKNDMRKVYYEAAEPFFTWEKAVGMCPVCFGFWVSVFSGLYFSQNVVDLLTIVVVSHVTIRILNKII